MSHAQQFAMWVELTLIWTVVLTAPGIAIAIFPDRSWKTTYRPSWPGFLLIALGWFPYGLPAMISMIFAAMFLSPSKLPMQKNTRTIAGTAAFIFAVALSIAHVYQLHTT